MPDTPVSAKARAIQDSALVIDTHADTPQRFLDENFDIGSADPNDLGHISLDSTQIYLTMTPELLQQACRRFERYVNDGGPHE